MAKIRKFENFGELQYPDDTQWIFAIENYNGDDNLQASITTLSYWDKNQCCDDSHIGTDLEAFFPDVEWNEVAESLFEFPGLSLDDIINKLCTTGLKPCWSFQAFLCPEMSHKFLNSIKKLGFEHTIIN